MAPKLYFSSDKLTDNDFCIALDSVPYNLSLKWKNMSLMTPTLGA